MPPGNQVTSAVNHPDIRPPTDPPTHPSHLPVPPASTSASVRTPGMRAVHPSVRPSVRPPARKAHPSAYALSTEASIRPPASLLAGARSLLLGRSGRAKGCTRWSVFRKRPSAPRGASACVSRQVSVTLNGLLQINFTLITGHYGPHPSVRPDRSSADRKAPKAVPYLHRSLDRLDLRRLPRT